MSNGDQTQDIVRRLDVLIQLMLDNLGDGTGMAIASKIYRLTDLGLSPAQTANILGKPTSYVTSTLHRRKKGASRKGGK